LQRDIAEQGGFASRPPVIDGKRVPQWRAATATCLVVRVNP
jgi:hypothetical protein